MSKERSRAGALRHTDSNAQSTAPRSARGLRGRIAVLRRRAEQRCCTVSTLRVLLSALSCFISGRFVSGPRRNHFAASTRRFDDRFNATILYIDVRVYGCARIRVDAAPCCAQTLQSCAPPGGISSGGIPSATFSSPLLREIPSLFILARSVVRLHPSLAAAPFGPPMTQPTCSSVSRILARSDSCELVVPKAETVGGVCWRGSGFGRTPPCARITARSTRF